MSRVKSTYCTSVNPSPGRNSSATYEWGSTDAGEPSQPEPCRLRRRLRGDRPGVHAKEPRRPCQRHPTQEPPPAEPSSVLDTAWEPPFQMLVSATPRTPASGLFFPRTNRRST